MPSGALPSFWDSAALPAVAGTEPTPPAAILLLEDDDAVAGLITMILARSGHAVIRARSCAEGLQCFRTESDRVALAIVDAGLPDGDGALIGRRLRELAPALPVLLTSGRDRSRFVDSCADPQIGYLAKPFRPAEVATAVGRLLGGSY
jgi:two-component system cell cycle sensor histidine kinase/response regulator CckA